MGGPELFSVSRVDPIEALREYGQSTGGEPPAAYLRLEGENLVTVKKAEMGVKDKFLLFLSRFGVGPYRLKKIAAKVFQLRPDAPPDANTVVRVQASLIGKIARHNSKWYTRNIDTKEMVTSFKATVQKATDKDVLEIVHKSLSQLPSEEPELQDLQTQVDLKIKSLKKAKSARESEGQEEKIPNEITGTGAGEARENKPRETQDKETTEETGEEIPNEITVTEVSEARESKPHETPYEETTEETGEELPNEITGTKVNEAIEKSEVTEGPQDEESQFQFLKELVDETSDIQLLNEYKEAIIEDPKLSEHSQELIKYIEDKQFIHESDNPDTDLRKILEDVYEADLAKLGEIEQSEILKKKEGDVPGIANFKFIIRDAIKQKKSYLEYVVQEAQQTAHVGFGIRNAGNSCYLNALLQAFYHSGIMDNCLSDEELEGMLPEMKRAATARIRIAEQELKNARENNASTKGPEEELLKAQMALEDVEGDLREAQERSSMLRAIILDIFERLRNGRIENIQEFRDYLIPNVIPIFGRYSQEDASELCTFLLEAMLARKVTYSHQSDGNQKIDEGRVMNYPITGVPSSINDLLQRGPYQFHEESLPEVIPISLGRFGWSEAFKLESKNKTSIMPDREILVPMKDGSQAKYELQAVVVHSGYTPHSGHYYTYVPRPDGRWTEYNDSFVSVPETQRAMDDICHNGYLYFYRRVQT